MENIQPKVMCKSCEMNFFTIFYFHSRKDALVAVIFIASIDGVPQVFSIIKLFTLLKVALLSRDGKAECFKMSGSY